MEQAEKLVDIGYRQCVMGDSDCGRSSQLMGQNKRTGSDDRSEGLLGWPVKAQHERAAQEERTFGCVRKAGRPGDRNMRPDVAANARRVPAL